MPSTTGPYPVTVTVGAVAYHGSYTVEDNLVRVTCSGRTAELAIGEALDPKRVAEGLLKTIAKRIAQDRR